MRPCGRCPGQHGVHGPGQHGVHRLAILTAVAISILFRFGDVAAQAAADVPVWTLSTAPELEIGEVTGDDTYLFESILSARFLPGGGIVVADGGTLAIRVYGPDGTIRSEMGGEGQGPGELMSLMGMWITPDGNIAAWDPRNRRISIFDPMGDVVATNRVRVDPEMKGTNLEVFFGSFENGDVLLASLGRAPVPGPGMEPVPDPWRLARFSLEGEPMEDLGPLRGMRRVGGNPISFTPLPYVATVDGALFRTDGYEPVLTRRDGDGRERRIELPRVAMDPKAAWSHLEAELRRRDHAMFLGLLERGQIPRDDRIPQIAGLMADDRGNLWVKAYDPRRDALWLRRGNAMVPGTGGEWRVVSAVGEPLAKVRLPEGVRPLEIGGDRFLGVSVDELDVERVVVHRIERR